MGFSRQEYWSGFPWPPPRDLPGPGIKTASLMSPALTGGFFTSSATWEAVMHHAHTYIPHMYLRVFIHMYGSPGGSVVRNLPANAGDTGSIPRSGKIPGEVNGNPLQYSCLGNPMDREAWRATAHGVTKSQTCLRDFTTTTIQTYITDYMGSPITRMIESIWGSVQTVSLLIYCWFPYYRLFYTWIAPILAWNLHLQHYWGLFHCHYSDTCHPKLLALGAKKLSLQPGPPESISHKMPGGWLRSWNQDCQEKCQQPQICR